MQRRRLVATWLTLGLVSWSVPAGADEPQPEAEVRRVLAIIGGMNMTDPTTKRRIETVLTDEALQQWRQGQFIQFRSDPEAVRLEGDYAVARFQRQGAVPYDVYLYLRHDPVWRLAAFRNMGRTGMLVQMKQELEAIWFRTPEQEARLANVRLSLATDRELRRWFDRHTTDLDALVRAYRKAIVVAPAPVPSPSDFRPPSGFLTEDPGATLPSSGYLTDDPVLPPPPVPTLTADQQAAASDIAAQVQALHLTGIDVLSERDAPGTGDQTPIRVIVGGLLADSVAFVHAPGGAPLMGPNHNIWVEPLGRDWYLVRTI